MSHLYFGLNVLCRGTQTCFPANAGPYLIYIFFVLHLCLLEKTILIYGSCYLDHLTSVSLGSKTKQGKWFGGSSVMSNELCLFGILGQWKGSDGVLRTQEIIGVHQFRA